MNNVLNDLQKHETRTKRNKDTYEQMKLYIRNKKCEIERIEKAKAANREINSKFGSSSTLKRSLLSPSWAPS